MIERKELEYSIEKKTNLDLTNTIGGPDERKWQTDELEVIDLTMQRLPRDHIDRPDGLHEISRIKSGGTGVGGLHSGHRIAITDNGVDSTPRYGESGEKREGTSEAVQAPKQLHQDLIERPAAEAKAAREKVSLVLIAMSDVPDTPANAQKLAQLQQDLDKNVAVMEEKQRTVEQRKGQFDAMRNDVFHTDKAAASARSRLGLTLDEKRLAEFDHEAATLSTPDQIKTLEERYSQ